MSHKNEYLNDYRLYTAESRKFSAAAQSLLLWLVNTDQNALARQYNENRARHFQTMARHYANASQTIREAFHYS